MKSTALRLFFSVFFFILFFQLAAQTPAAVVRYKPLPDVSIGKNDSLKVLLRDSVFYETTGAALTYEASLLSNNTPAALPSWITFKTTPLSFLGKASQSNEGVYQLMLKASNGTVFATDTFRLEVVNHAPIVSKALPGLIFAQGFATAQVDISKTFTDKDGDVLTYSVTSSAATIVKATITGTSITLVEVAQGSADITVTATDNEGKSITNVFTVLVRKYDEVFGFTTENTGSNGLIESWVHSVYIESNSEIWVGTDLGLSVYNPSLNKWTNSLKEGDRSMGSNKVTKILKTSTGTKCLLVSRGFQLATSTGGFTYYDKMTIPELGDFVNTGEIDADDKLWLVINKSNVLYLVRYNFLTKQVELNQQLGNATQSHNLIIDAAKTPWIATDKGLMHYQTSGITTYNSANGLSKDYVYNVAYRNGKVYSVLDGAISIYDGTTFKSLNNSKLFNVRDNALTIDAKGDIWTSSLNYGILHYNETAGWQTVKLNFLGSTFAFDYPIYDIKIDAQNRVWVASRWGLLMYANSNFPFADAPVVYNTYDGLPANDVYRILKDNKGNTWFPTFINGVSKYDGQNWTWIYQTVPFDAAIWLQNTTAAYIAKNGDIWLGGAGGISVTSDGNTWRSFTSVDYNNANSVLNMNNVMAISEDAAKNIWVGGVGFTTNMGLNKYDGQHWSAYKVADGLKSNSIRSLFGDSKGNMWVAYNDVITTSSITKIPATGSMVHYATVANTTPNFSFISQLLETSDGKIWVATNTGIGIFDGTSWTTFKMANGLLSDQVSQMAIDGLGNVWISYPPTLQLGVSMYNGTKWQHFNKQNGLPSNQINSLQTLVTSAGTTGGRTQAVAGTLWLGTSTEGVSRIDIDGFLKPTVVTVVTAVETENTTDLVVYPNPADNVLILQLKEKLQRETAINIVDITGRVCQSTTVVGEKIVEVPVEKLRSGVYLVQWRDNAGMQSRRFVKK